MEHFAPLISFNWTLVMNWVTVLVLFLILKKFFFEKVHNFVLAREAAVKDAFDNAESTNRKADEKLEAYNKRIANIESEGRDLIKNAKSKADDQARQIIEEANKKAESIMIQAQTEIEREQRKALSEMRDQIAALAILAAQKIIEKDLEATGQDALIDKIIEEAGGAEWQN